MLFTMTQAPRVLLGGNPILMHQACILYSTQPSASRQDVHIFTVPDNSDTVPDTCTDILKWAGSAEGRLVRTSQRV